MATQRYNVVGPQVRRLRSGKGWSQNDLAIKLQILGMANVSRCKIAKIETRRVSIADEELIFISRALGVSTELLYPDFIRSAKRLYDAICSSKASPYGLFIFGLLSCSMQGTGACEFIAMIASV